MKNNSDRFLTTVFCDDIRQEAGNKLSFMGCYQSELYVPSAPVSLSKFCIYVAAWTPKERPFKTLKFKIIQDNDIELSSLEIPAEGIGKNLPIGDETATRIQIYTAIVFSPFYIEKPTMLRIIAETEEGKIIGPRILIKVAPEQMLPDQQIKKKKSGGKMSIKKRASKKAAL